MSDDADISDAYVSISELHTEHRLYSNLKQLREFYCKQFDSEPEFFVRVPGRVNIIGEHVDYCGYPVLPMAIEQCIFLAVGHNESDSFLHLRNVEFTKFDNFKCDLNCISIDLPDQGGPEWYKYYLCGVKGIYETLGDKMQTRGMTVALSGNIPSAAGLSSSSALVSAAALATAYVHNLPLDRKRLASISAHCEHYIGTEGGGMDQAIAYLAKKGCAHFIQFHPVLNATPVALPKKACFVVANSLANKNKAASSDFNERVVECRLSARIIAKYMHLDNWRDIIRFAQLQSALNCSLLELEKIALNSLHKEIYTRSEVCKLLGVESNELEMGFLTPNTRHMQLFKLQQRTLHVLQESLRVLKFRSICEGKNYNTQYNGNCKNNNENFESIGKEDSCEQTFNDLDTLSQLMRQSHESLKNLYECSHPDLDRLINISDSLGIGARLTGAGWGGCVVALCDSVETSAKYIKTLKDDYFTKLPPHILNQHKHNEFQDVIFSTFPCEGAEIILNTK